MLISGRVVEGIGLDVVFARRRAGAQHDEGDGFLPFDVVIDRDDAGLRDGRVMFEYGKRDLALQTVLRLFS